MSFITQGKANIKYLLIIGLVAAVAGEIIFICWNSYQKEIVILNSLIAIKIPEKNIEKETANWKTYRNEKYGFEFKYPGEYDNYPFCKIEEDDNMIKIGKTFFIETLDSKGLSLLDYIAKEKEFSQVLPPPAEEWNQKNINIGGIEGIKVIWSYGARYSKMIYLLKDSKIYKISFDAGIGCSEDIITKDIPSELEVFEQIPSTFKFISTSTGEIANCLKKYPKVEVEGCISGKVVDGWQGAILYSNTLNTSNITHYTDAPAPDIVKQAGIASYITGGSNCETTWRIKVNGEWEDMNQLDFCNFIIKYDSSCNKCLLEWKEGCC